MPRGVRSDTGSVALGRRAYTAIRRHLLGAAACATLFALCVCVCALASTAPASTPAKSSSSHASAPAKHKRHRHCARRASFHSSGGKPTGSSHHRKRRFLCRRHKAFHHKAVHRKTVHHKTSQRQTSGYGSPPPAPTGACTETKLQPTAANLQRVRAATLCLVDRERTSRGLSALAPDGPLAQAAQAHSEDMAAGDYFEHDGRHGDTPLSRMRASGYIFSSHIGYAVGENIAWATLWMASPQAIVAGWMASPGHRANILDATFRDSGVGISPHPLASLAHGQAGAIYTQDFGRIIKP
jgi:uncharacterized protein YkwD